MELSLEHINDLLDKKNYPLSHCNIFSYNPHILAQQEFERNKNNYLSKFQLNSTLDKLSYFKSIIEISNLIYQKEFPYHKELTTIASDIIKNLYDIPNHIVIKPQLKKWEQISINNSVSNPLNISPKQKEKLLPHIQKRIMLNTLVFGSSLHIWKTIYHIAKKEINKIDKSKIISLFELYEKYTNLIGIYLYVFFNDNPLGAKVQGKEKIDFKDDKIFIEVESINFPVLLHEINKGAIDALILNGIDKNLNEEELKFVYQESDKYEYEAWHQILSPSIWVKLLGDWKIPPTQIPEKINELCKMETNDLKEYLIKIQK